MTILVAKIAFSPIVSMNVGYRPIPPLLPRKLLFSLLNPDSDDLDSWFMQCDLILDTISNQHDLIRWFLLPRRGGKLCLVGVPTKQLEVFQR